MLGKPRRYNRRIDVTKFILCRSIEFCVLYKMGKGFNTLSFEFAQNSSLTITFTYIYLLSFTEITLNTLLHVKRISDVSPDIDQKLFTFVEN